MSQQPRTYTKSFAQRAAQLYPHMLPKAPKVESEDYEHEFCRLWSSRVDMDQWADGDMKAVAKYLLGAKGLHVPLGWEWIIPGDWWHVPWYAFLHWVNHVWLHTSLWRKGACRYSIVTLLACKEACSWKYNSLVRVSMKPVSICCHILAYWKFPACGWHTLADRSLKVGFKSKRKILRGRVVGVRKYTKNRYVGIRKCSKQRIRNIS